MASVFSSLSALEQESVLVSVKSARQYLRGRVLDMGCGDQPYARLITETSTQYVGMDLSPEHTPKPHVCADSLALPFRSGSFDAVLSTQVLEHVRNPFTVFREISRVLKPSGYLVLTAPQLWPLHEEPHDYYRYTRYGLQELALQHGLAVVRLEERGGGFTALGQLTAVMLNDLFGRRFVTRALTKAVVAPALLCCRGLDRMIPYRKLTLGYLLVAQKNVSSERNR